MVLWLSIVVAFIDAIGLSMFLPLLQMADGKQEATSEGLGGLAFIVEGMAEAGIVLNLVTVLLIVVLVFSLKGVVTYASRAYTVSVRQFFIRTLRLKLLNGLSSYSYKAYVVADIGRVQNSLTGEVARVTNAYVSYFNCLQALFLVLVYMSFAFVVDWRFAFLTTVGGLLTNVAFRNIYAKTKEGSRRVTTGNSSFHGLLIQFLTHFKYLKATGYLEAFIGKLRRSILDIEESNKRIGHLEARITAAREPLLIVVVCFVIMIQVYAIGGSLSAVLVSLLFFYRSLASLMTVQSNYNTFLSVAGSLENIKSFERELKEGKEMNGKLQFARLKTGLKLKNVSFSYDQNDLVLKNISLEIPCNQTVAFVGESGSGKTTLVNVISGLVAHSGGSFTIDGLPAESLEMASYRKRIGYISQDPVVFNDTVFNNVTFWAEPSPEVLSNFQKAISQASLESLVDQLPAKEQTLLGNNGVNLSGGQKQRVSIARELYKDVDILILDEATSALDSETEIQIQQNIESLRGVYTILIIAHRLSTVKNADVVYLMDKGEILCSGSFDDLMRTSEKFRKMVSMQEIRTSTYYQQ